MTACAYLFIYTALFPTLELFSQSLENLENLVTFSTHQFVRDVFTGLLISRKGFVSIEIRIISILTIARRRSSYFWMLPYLQWAATAGSRTYLIWQICTLDAFLDAIPKGICVSFQKQTGDLSLFWQMCKPLICGDTFNMICNKYGCKFICGLKVCC